MKTLKLLLKWANCFILITILAFIGNFPNWGFAQPTHTCCWSPINKMSEKNFEGKVISVAPEKKEIAIEINHKEYDFKFDKKNGSKKQESLLYKVKTGDTIRGIKMDNKNMYHFEK